MKIDFNQEIKDFLTGKALINKLGKPVSLLSVCIEALLSNPPNNKATATEKFNRYQLAIKVSESKEVQSEEIALIKKTS